VLHLRLTGERRFHLAAAVLDDVFQFGIRELLYCLGVQARDSDLVELVGERVALAERSMAFLAGLVKDLFASFFWLGRTKAAGLPAG